ncbi:hypothetical protein KY290_010289 [Solanum tuberosum]|uniref:Uncharacterized protein n=1 Tax=Solanum tuberosum TaxID=4113 RepID=A0ABQ7VXD1_SOLTU|nr:hypothetical protein KY289_010676 [Solanum tuberosum]KAH0773152.1 hypothetical protein KY290_010289 [Solanum tuberosum]
MKMVAGSLLRAAAGRRRLAAAASKPFVESGKCQSGKVLLLCVVMCCCYGSVHIAATLKFCLLRRSSLVGAVQPQGFVVVVVVVDLVVRTEVGLHGGCLGMRER